MLTSQIGINLADPIFRGRYHGKQRHPDDLAGVVQRARDVGCTKLIVTGSSFQSSRDALKLAEQFRRCPSRRGGGEEGTARFALFQTTP